MRTTAVEEAAVVAAVRKSAKKAEGATKKSEKKAVKASREVKILAGTNSSASNRGTRRLTRSMKRG